MTKEESIAYGKECLSWNKFSKGMKMYQFIEMAIKALEQEPCEDAISRQAVFEQINCWIGSGEYRYTNATDYLIKRIKALQTVNPQPKMGYWFVDERPESDREIICSNCEQHIFKYHKLDFDYRPKYCPNCGARMESEE